MKQGNSKWAMVRLTAIVIITMISSLGCIGQKVERIKIPELPPPVAKRDKPFKVALVLGAGGFRGGAHIGVIEVLEENGIQIDLIVGSSAGSFVGAFYADHPNAAALKTKLLSARYDQLVDTNWIQAMHAPFCPTGPIRGHALQRFMRHNMHSQDFNELKIPLVVVTTSIINNQAEIIQSGPIIPAVHASSALPPYFAPVRIYENTFIDGGVVAPVPVGIAKTFNPKMIIAVEITKRPSYIEPGNAFEITTRAIDISFSELAKSQSNMADVVIRPDIIGYGPFEDKFNHEFYEAGRKAALEKIELIKKKTAAIN